MARQLVALVVLSLLSLFASGCSRSQSIVVWHAYRGEEEKTLAALAKRYEAERGVSIELLALPFDAYSAKLTAAVPRDHGPDLFIEAHERLGIYRRENVVAPVGDALPDADLASYDESALEAVTQDNQRWGVPLSTKCVALYVNDDLVRQVPVLDDIAELRRTLPKDVYPLAYEAENPYYHSAILSAFGGQLLGADGSYAFVGEAAERSLALVRGLLAQNAIPADASGALVKQLFSAGHAAMAIDGPWLAADLPGKLHYHVTRLPSVRHGSSAMRPPLTVEAAMLSPSGARRPEVRAFARWLGGETSAVSRAIEAHQVVSNLAAWRDPRLSGDALLAAFHEQQRDALPMPTSTRMRAVWVPAQEAIRKVFRDVDPRSALQEGERRFNDALKSPPASPSPLPIVIVAGLLGLAGAWAAVRRSRATTFRAEWAASKTAYGYVAHAGVVVVFLVVLPLMAGAFTSLFAGTYTDPRYVGLGNYMAILTARGGPLLGHGSFYVTLLVTVLWTVSNVALHLALGVALAVVLSRPAMKLRSFYRVLLIVPWAVPSYVTALAWKGMFHRQFGAVNALLSLAGLQPVSWFSHFATSFAANVTTNTWLGFPFMMVVTMGALTSIPKEVLEAADVDGATRWQRFQKVTLPLLRPTLLPAVVLGSVWTFNMFNVVFLVSGGEPDGATDILVSDAYRWAFTRDAQYGYAAAYAVLICIILAGGSHLLSRISTATPAAATGIGTQPTSDR